jgi:hypothetical protein
MSELYRLLNKGEIKQKGDQYLRADLYFSNLTKSEHQPVWIDTAEVGIEIDDTEVYRRRIL